MLVKMMDIKQWMAMTMKKRKWLMAMLLQAFTALTSAIFSAPDGLWSYVLSM
jgi:hypothetical protein